MRMQLNHVAVFHHLLGGGHRQPLLTLTLLLIFLLLLLMRALVRIRGSAEPRGREERASEQRRLLHLHGLLPLLVVQFQVVKLAAVGRGVAGRCEERLLRRKRAEPSHAYAPGLPKDAQARLVAGLKAEHEADAQNRRVCTYCANKDEKEER